MSDGSRTIVQPRERPELRDAAPAWPALDAPDRPLPPSRRAPDEGAQTRPPTTAIRVAPNDLATGLAVLANLLGSSLPIGRVLDAFDSIAPERWRPSLPSVRRAVRSGRGLSHALAEGGILLPSHIIAVIRAGEEGGALSAAVHSAATMARQQADARAALLNAMAYPMLLVIAGLATLGLMVGIVLPRFALLLGDMNVALPSSTRALLSLGVLLKAAIVPGSVAAGAAAVAAVRLLREERFRSPWHEALRTVPLIGLYRRRIATARVCRILSTLTLNGVTLARALPVAAEGAGDQAVTNRLRAARESIVGGASPSIAFERSDALTQTATHLVRAGEASGTLADMLTYAAALEQDAAEQLLKRATRLLEPLMVAGLGGLIAAMAAALLQAMYAIRVGNVS